MAFNSISDLSPVSLEDLELLDLEENEVEDLAQLWYLGLLCEAQDTFTGRNPVCTVPLQESLRYMKGLWQPVEQSMRR